MSAFGLTRDRMQDRRCSLFLNQSIYADSKRRRSSYFRERLPVKRYDEMIPGMIKNSPKRGRKYSQDTTRFQQAPGAPRLSLKSGSISILYRPEETSNPVPWRKRTMSNGGEEEEAYSVALVGAPRLNLSHSNGTDDTLSECNISSTSITGKKQAPCLPSISSTPWSGVQLSKKSLLFSSESPINKFTRDEGSTLEQIPNSLNMSNRPSIIVFRCRICYEEGSGDEPLISPCHCRGSVGLLHKKCLERWLQVSQTLKCELCDYAYILRPKPMEVTTNVSKTSVTQFIDRMEFFRDWIHSRLVRRNLLTDLIFLALLTPTSCLGVYFCINAMYSFMAKNPQAWQVIALIALATTLIVVLFCWIVLAVRHHLSAYFAHRQHREARIREAFHRRSLERRWRFSVHPRPRGSSFALQSSTPLCQSIRSAHLSPLSATMENRNQLSPPQCALVNVTSPDFTLNLYPVEEITEGGGEGSEQDILVV